MDGDSEGWTRARDERKREEEGRLTMINVPLYVEQCGETERSRIHPTLRVQPMTGSRGLGAGQL